MRAAVLAALLASAAAWGAAPAGSVAPDRVERLIDRLGSGGFRDREAASRELDTLAQPLSMCCARPPCRPSPRFVAGRPTWWTESMTGSRPPAFCARDARRV